MTLTLKATPLDATHWSTRAMAARCGVSQSTVGQCASLDYFPVQK